MRAAIAALLVSASAAYAAPCDLNGVEPVADFERAKSAFLSADYDRVIRSIGMLPDEQKDVALAQIEQVRAQLPTTYTSCQVIVQRRDVALVQEITAFYSPQLPAPMLFYLLAMPYEGEMRTMEFHFDGRAATVMGRLK